MLYIPLSYYTGSPYVDPKYQSPLHMLNNSVFSGAKVLHVSEDELKKELNDFHDAGKSGHGGTAVTTDLTVIFLVALLVAGFVFGLILVLKYFRY